MRINLILSVLILLASSLGVLAHDDDDHDPIIFEFYNIEMPLSETGLDPACMGKDEAFLHHASMVAISCDENFMTIESFSFAVHEMMVGITLWNGQVPVPQPIIGENSWQIPMNPVLSGVNTPTVGQGPIAVAVNGVMIFNPTKQDGVYALDSDPYLIGELDYCGGHSGRGDDYHYHIAPVCILDHLSNESDGILPIAYALDGFPIYGFTNADGSTPALDECNGEFDENGNYHYHATADYPYINGCFKGAFDTSMQPPQHPIREAIMGQTSPHVLITALYQDDTQAIHMEYEVDGVLHAIIYHEVDALCFEYQFVDDVANNIVSSTETYCRNENGPNNNPPPNDGNPPPRNDSNPPPRNDGDPPPSNP